MSPPIDQFLHLTDFHFWKVTWNPLRLMNKRVIGNTNVLIRRRKEFRQDRARRFADYALSLGINDILMTGDFASTALDEEFQRAREFVAYFEDNGARVTVIPGNHDVYTFESVRKNRFQTYLGKWTPPQHLPAIVRLTNGTPIVLVPTVRPNFINSSGGISQAEVDATGRLLGELTSGPVIAAAHYPLLHNTDDYVTKKGRRLDGADALRRELARTGKSIAFFAGHVHQNSFARDPECDRIFYLTTGAFFYRNAATGTTGAFTEVSVGAEQLSIIRHCHREAWQLEGKEILYF